MKKILVTGGLGFIGTNFINIALKNFKITNLDIKDYCSNKKFLKNKKNYVFHKIDISKDTTKIQKILKEFNPDYLVNFAANSHVDNSIIEPKNFFLNNIKCTLNLLNIIVNNKNFIKKIKFIHIGTDEIYGEIKKNEKRMFNEKSIINPNSPYSASKASCHHLVKCFSKTYGLKYLIINPSNNFGPYQYPEKLVPKTILSILHNKKVIVYKKGKNIRQWTHVFDTCKVIIKLMKGKKFNEVYNVGFGKCMKNIELIKLIYKIITKTNTKKKLSLKLKFVDDRKGHDFKYNSSNIKLSKIIKLNTLSLYNNLEKTIEWYKDPNNLNIFMSKK